MRRTRKMELVVRPLMSWDAPSVSRMGMTDLSHLRYRIPFALAVAELDGVVIALGVLGSEPVVHADFVGGRWDAQIHHKISVYHERSQEAARELQEARAEELRRQEKLAVARRRHLVAAMV